MKLSHNDLLTIEERHNVITIQSDYPEIAYAIGHGSMWIINRRTGQELEIAAENIHPFADEMLSVADLYLPQNKMWRKGA